MMYGTILKLVTRLAIVVSCCASGHAIADQRVALVVGNGAYNTVDALDNPVSDASLMADRLRKLGFEVDLLTNSSLTNLNQSISNFGRKLRAGGKETTGLFYYAGHGVQSFGNNYLLPVDINLTDAADLDLVAVEAGSVLRQMFSARNNTNIVILDACRNNPFDALPEFGNNGLAEMRAPTGTYLAYATAPGAVALDGADGNSPFTAALANEMLVAGAPIEQVFKNVRNEVIEQTGGQQTPWDTSSLTNQFFFTPPVVEDPGLLAERKMWESVKDTGDMLQVMLFLRAYPEGAYEPDARSLLAKIVMDDGQKPGEKATTAAATPEIATPESRESELIAEAQSTGELAAYEAYIAAYPKGVFAELALTEIATLREKAAKGEATPTPEVAPEPEPTVATEVVVVSASPGAAAKEIAEEDLKVTFTEPLVVGSADIVGRSIAELVKGSPLYPPIEGLPESVWANETCSGCHKWTQEALCNQSQVYISANAERSLAKQHPYGGTFKNNLKIWARDGCQ